MNVSLEKFSDCIKPYLLQTVAICTDRKIIRKGKLRIFQIKQHYAKLTLEDEVRTRIYEIPYPFDISTLGTKTILCYKLDKFLNVDDLQLQVKFLDSSKKSKIYNENLYIMPLDEVDL
tara:strand:- start:4680 stop:5033 length:354 start_codon:yes stop_codon:yes gene_type:complete